MCPRPCILNVETELSVIKVPVTISYNPNNQFYLPKAEHYLHHYSELVGSTYSSNYNFFIILSLDKITH